MKITFNLINYTIQKINPQSQHELPQEIFARLFKTVLVLLKECFLSISLRENFTGIIYGIIISVTPQPDAKFLKDFSALFRLSPAAKLMVALSLVQEADRTSEALYNEAARFLFDVLESLPPPPQKPIEVSEGPFFLYLSSLLENNPDLTKYRQSISCAQMAVGGGGEVAASRRRQLGPMTLPLVVGYRRGDPADIIYRIGPECSMDIGTFRSHVFSGLTKPLTELDVVHMINAIIK